MSDLRSWRKQNTNNKLLNTNANTPTRKLVAFLGSDEILAAPHNVKGLQMTVELLELSFIYTQELWGSLSADLLPRPFSWMLSLTGWPDELYKSSIIVTHAALLQHYSGDYSLPNPFFSLLRSNHINPPPLIGWFNHVSRSQMAGWVISLWQTFYTKLLNSNQHPSLTYGDTVGFHFYCSK